MPTFVRKPREIDLVYWDGTNPQEVADHFAARGWVVLADPDGVMHLARGVSNNMGGSADVPVLSLSNMGHGWLRDVYDPAKNLIGMWAIELILDDGTGTPSGYSPAS